MVMDLPDWQFGFAIIPRTVLRPNQSVYWASTSVIVPPQSSVITTIGQGYTIGDPWIPEGQTFSIWYVIFSANQNSLMLTAILLEGSGSPGQYTVMGWRYGYGEAEYPAGIFYEFWPGSRPVYYVYNFADNEITVAITIFGVVEKII